MIYIIAFLISFSFCWLYIKTNKRQRFIKFFLYFLSTLPLIVLSAIRYNVGTDYYNTYVVSFYEIKDGGEVLGYDALFALFNKILVFVFDNPQWVFVTTSIIIGYLIFKSIRLMSVNAP